MRLLRLECHDFAQYADMDVDLSELTEVALIGENGAGKSQWMNMASWCLYGRPVRGTIDQLIRTGANGTWVRTTWDHEGSEVVILRTRSIETKAGESSVALQVDGIRQTRHTIAETQEEIVKLAGLTYDQLLATSWMPERRSAAFMELQPAKAKALFASLLELDRFEPWRDRASTWAQNCEREVALLTDRLARWQEHLADEPLAVKACDDAEAALEAAQVAEAAAERDEAALRLKAETLAEQLREAHTLGVKIDQSNGAIAEYERQIKALEDVAATFAATAQPPATSFDREAWAEKVRDARAQRAALIGVKATLQCEEKIGARPDEIARLRAVVERDGHWEEDAVEFERQAVQAKADHEAALLAWQRYEKDRERAAGAGKAIAQLRDSIASLNVMVAEWNAERMRLLQVQAEAEEAAEGLRAATTRLRQASADRARAEERLEVSRQRLEELRDLRVKVEAAEVECAQHERKARGYRIAEKAFHRDGVPTMILATTTPAVEAKANELLSRMPGDLAIRLTLQTLTKAGEWRDELDTLVIEANVERPYEVLSNAERFRIDLAVRIGMGSVLLTRAGRKFETAFFDEAFSAQSATHLQAVLESIAAVASEFGLLIVVTHQQEVADRFLTKRLIETNDLGLAEVRAA